MSRLTAAVQGRAAATLAVLGAGTAALCAGVAADHHEGLIAGTAGPAVAVVAYALLPTAIGLLPCGGFVLLTVTGLLDLLVRQDGTGWGLAYVALGWDWTDGAVLPAASGLGIVLHRRAPQRWTHPG